MCACILSVTKRDKTMAKEEEKRDELVEKEEANHGQLRHIYRISLYSWHDEVFWFFLLAAAVAPCLFILIQFLSSGTHISCIAMSKNGKQTISIMRAQYTYTRKKNYVIPPKQVQCELSALVLRINCCQFFFLFLFH